MTDERIRRNRKQTGSGSPQPGGPAAYLSIGKLRRPHGIQGEILMEVETDFPDEIQPGMQIFLGEEKVEFTLVAVRRAIPHFLVSLASINDRESAGQLRNKQVYSNASSVKPLPTGTFYLHEVVGMRVFDETGAVLGEVAEVIKTGANDVYVVKKINGGELLLPAIKAVVLKMDRESKSMVVRPQEWF